MYMTIFLLIITKISSISIPFIENVFLQSFTQSNLNITVRYNISCEQCLCDEFNSTNNNNDYALNCFSNNTCQFFQNFPLSYTIKSSSGSRLYFLQNQFPNPSQCCMPNITELLARLQNGLRTVMNLTFQPGAMGYDESNPNEATVTGWSAAVLYWFNPFTLTFIRNFSIDGASSVAVYNNQTFTSHDSVVALYIRDSQTNNRIANITYSSLGQIRKVIFINNGQTAVVSTQKNYTLTFFDVHSPTNYTLQREVLCPLTGVHGIAKVNDTFLYVSAWTSRSIYSYKFENSTWTGNLFVNYTVTGSGAFLTVDDCGRVWFVNTAFGLRIYNSSGIEIANWNMSAIGMTPIYDLLFLSNYILLVSSYTQQKIVSYNPQVTCS